MSLYVTLPSNSSTVDYPANRQSNYTTTINPPIVLNGPSEVALVDITYSPQITINLGTIQLLNPFWGVEKEKEPWLLREKYLTFDVKVQNGEDSITFFKNLNFELEKKVLLAEYKLMYEYAFVPHISQNEKLRAYMDEQQRLHEADNKYLPIICAGANGNDGYYIMTPDENNEFYRSRILLVGGKYDHEMNRYTITKAQLLPLEQKCFVNLFNLIATKKNTVEVVTEHLDLYGSIREPADREYAGIAEDVDKFVKLGTMPTFIMDKYLQIVHKATYQEDDLKFTGILNQLLDLKKLRTRVHIKFMSHINLLYYSAVYCDIIEDQYVGDAHGPIIRVININSNITNDSVTLFENPHYVNCNKSIINSVNIKILDLEGNPIQFENKFGYVILKLHIRRKNDF